MERAEGAGFVQEQGIPHDTPISFVVMVRVGMGNQQLTHFWTQLFGTLGTAQISAGRISCQGMR